MFMMDDRLRIPRVHRIQPRATQGDNHRMLIMTVADPQHGSILTHLKLWFALILTIISAKDKGYSTLLFDLIIAELVSSGHSNF